MTEAHLNRMQTTKTETRENHTVKASKQKMPPSPHPPVTGKTSKRQKTDKKQENYGLHDGLHDGKNRQQYKTNFLVASPTNPDAPVRAKHSQEI